MEFSNLINLIQLYKTKEKVGKLSILKIVKKNDLVIFELGMSDNSVNSTSISINKSLVNLSNIEEILHVYKDNNEIIKEERNNLEIKYFLDNGRILVINNFSLEEQTVFQKKLYGVNDNVNEIKVDFTSDDVEDKKEFKELQMGFVGFKSIMIIALIFVFVIILCLFIIKYLV